MKCLIKNIIIFSKIMKLNFNESYSSFLIKKSVFTLINKKILKRFRSSLKSPYYYSLNQISFSIKNLNRSKLFYTIVNIPLSVFQNYSWRYNIKPNDFEISILKKKINFLTQNLSSILHDLLKTNLNSFHSDFRLHLKSYISNISKINNYIKENSLKSIKNPMFISSVTDTPNSLSIIQSSFYPRYVFFLNLKRRLTRMFFFLRP